MKKLICIAAALMMVGVFATSSFAANKVQMTLTSPTIYKAGCEKIGSTTYEFDAGSNIGNGDWWYMDLPEGITLCKSYNYIIAAANNGSPLVYFNSAAANPYQNATFWGNAGLNGLIDTAATGPLTLGGESPSDATITGNMAFLVQGTSGSRRITIYALNDIGATGTVGADATSFIAPSQTTIQFKLFDGKSWSDGNGIAGANNDNRILLDTDGDGLYGEVGPGATDDEFIGGVWNAGDVTGGVPYVENTLCSNNASLSGQYIYTSYASKGDEFTFSGDSQIAHTASSGSISLEQCHKSGTLKGDIALSSTQSTTCQFAYETAGSYCDTAFKNRFIIKAASAFGDIGDKYTVSAEITAPADGVYFATGGPAVYTYASSADACTASLPTAETITWIAYEGSTVATGYAPTNCTINTGYRVDKVVQNGTITTIDLDSKNQIYMDFNNFAYGSTMVAAGEEVTVKVTLNRYPCGEIFSASRTIGSFVASCTTSSSTTLYFPWMPGTGAASSGWWGGYVITNVGSASGTAALTYYDANGKSATYTTPAVAAGAQFNGTTVGSSDLTDVNGYDGSLNFSIKAVCAFAARGFAFTGNTREGVGYTAEQ